MSIRDDYVFTFLLCCLLLSFPLKSVNIYRAHLSKFHFHCTHHFVLEDAITLLPLFIHKLIKFLLYCFFIGQQHKVQCTEDVMKVLVALPDNNTRVYLEGLNGYKIEKCEPKINENLAVFELSLINFYDCGLIRVVNKLTVSRKSN